MDVHKQKNIELKKHVSTIHCSNTLSLLQRKIANALLYHAYDDLLKKDEHQISIRDLCLLIGYESHDYKTIKKALVDLLSTVIEWNIIAEDAAADEQYQWNASSIIADASICGSVCSYSYSNKMKQLLYTPSIYGRLNMAIQAKFKSSYGLALYENSIRYQNLKQTPWFDMQIFRKLMGVEENKYLIFRDFKRRVLDKAIAEVNAYAPISITAQYKREQRNIIAIRFDIYPNNNSVQLLSLGKVDSQGELSQKLKHIFGLTDKQIAAVCKNYEHSYIIDKINLIELSSTFRDGKIINLAKYLLSALSENYQPPKKSITQDKVKSKKIQTEQPSVMETQQKKDYANFLTIYYQDIILKLLPKEKEELGKKFFEHLTNKESDFLLNLYRKDGLSSKFVEMEFRQFLRIVIPEKLTKIPSFEEFLQKYAEEKEFSL